MYKLKGGSLPDKFSENILKPDWINSMNDITSLNDLNYQIVYPDIKENLISKKESRKHFYRKELEKIVSNIDS